MRLLCHLGFHRWEITAERWETNVRKPGSTNEMEDRWIPLQRCYDCGVLRWIEGGAGEDE